MYYIIYIAIIDMYRSTTSIFEVAPKKANYVIRESVLYLLVDQLCQLRAREHHPPAWFQSPGLFYATLPLHYDERRPTTEISYIDNLSTFQAPRTLFKYFLSASRWTC